MSFRHSHMLLAAMAMIAAPSFAQEAEEPASNAQESGTEMTAPAAAENEAGQTAGEAASDAEEATSENADTMEEAMPTEDAAGTDADAAEAGAAETGTTGAEEPAAETESESAGTETTAPEPDTDAAATADEEAPESAQPPADAAADSAEEAEVGQPYIQAEYQDWAIRCIKANQGTDPCVLNQLLLDETDNPVAEVNFIPLQGQEAAAGGTFIAPLETDLIMGLGVTIDRGQTRGYPFNVCTARDGCVARIGFTSQELGEFKRGNQAIVSLLPYGANPENPIQLPMSLAGFTAGLDELTQMAEEAQAPAEDAAQEETPAE